MPPRRQPSPRPGVLDAATTRSFRRVRDRAAEQGTVSLFPLAIAADATARALAKTFVIGEGGTRHSTRVADELGQLPATLAAALAAGGRPPNATAAISLARSAAVGLHVGAHLRWLQGRREPGRTAGGLRKRLVAADRTYVAHLGRLRRALMDQDPLLAAAVAASAAASAQDQVAPLCREAARVGRRDTRPAAVAALRSSGLARRYAALVAAAELLVARLAVPRSAKSTAAAAERARTLRRPPPDPSRVRTVLGAADTGQHVAVVGRIAKLEFIERPRKPYSRVVLTRRLELHVPYRNVRRLGLTPGAWTWAAGEAKSSGDGPVLEVEFEGPGQHRSAVFEDFLADLVRRVYDLYPGVVLLEWAFPDVGEAGGPGDLAARLNVGAR